MQSRRDFLKNAALLTGAVGMWGTLESSIRTALAIEPDPNTSYLDAEHIVILMQENRSFDHAFGTLQGVRGYNDPRAIKLPNNNPVWVQTNAAGQSYAPFRLNINDTNATWMGFLPHNWASQVDARNNGKHDHWLEAKKSGHKEYASLPLTLGHYTRQDIPFYYALADAFTVCDQHFCSSLTPTLPNRLYFMTGTVREEPTPDSPANVRNEQIIHNTWKRGWTTFPERLEDLGVSWKIYQNEIDLPSGLFGEEDAWLGNFGTNMAEYFKQYHAPAHQLHRQYMEKISPTLPDRIASLKKQLDAPDLTKAQTEKLKTSLTKYEDVAKYLEEEQPHWNENDFEKLSPLAKALYEKAFTTNSGDPDYRELVEMTYQDAGTPRTMKVPKGDVLHQFREDVRTGKLPTVTWLSAPERLSDHPESAWYGAWYISEVFKILTENPDLWKKTVFILTYDENDGYFDHVPPFVAPRPNHPETGFISKTLDATIEYVELEQDAKLNLKGPRQSPIGLGYRVPMIVASPWTRGGCVCSQVFDNTSILMFLENFLTHKTGKPVVETNISSWRRSICGNLTSLFQSTTEEKTQNPQPISRDPFVQQIFTAQFKPPPSGFKPLTKTEIQEIADNPFSDKWMSRQEPGIRPSSPLPYELYVNGSLSDDRKNFTISLEAHNDAFADRTVGCPFTIYARAAHDLVVRNYAVAPGDRLQDSWPLADFPTGIYHLQVHGPNGFLREFIGAATDPNFDIDMAYTATNKSLDGNLEARVTNLDPKHPLSIRIADLSYNAGEQKRLVAPNTNELFTIDTQRSHHWYDIAITFDHATDFHRHYAGRVETGQWSYSDPAMAGPIT